MDPRLLLGVDVRASRSEVRAAHRRLRRALDPAAGGTPELCRLVDVAAAAVLTGRRADLSVDPHAVLGVPPAASRDVTRAAYRRLVRITHPDLGGTDELFRVVVAAHDVLTDATGRRARRRWTPPRAEPPGPPPPRGPYRAPAPEERRVRSTWRAWRDLVQHGAVLSAAVALGALAFSASRGLAIAFVVVALLAWESVLRPAKDGALRAAVVLLGARVRVAPEVDPERFLEETCLDAPVGRQREDELYAAYVRWCRRRGDPVAPWVFVERLRALGLLFIKSSAWESGLWVGVVLRR